MWSKIRNQHITGYGGSMETTEVSVVSNNTNLDIYKNEFIKKSNIFISSKYNSTLLENKILALAFSKRERNINPDNTYRIEIPASEIKMMLGKSKKNNSVYAQLAKVADSLTGHKLYFVDEENHRFKITTLVHTATYDNGILTLDFPETVVRLIDNDAFGFTKLPLTVLFKFSSVQSFRIYEHLKSKAYLLERQGPNQEICVQWGLSELKINCACIDTDEENVKKALQSEKPDFDKIVNEIAKTNLYPEWRDFRRVVLETAKREINTVSDIHIEYDTVRTHRGGKVIGVIFRVSMNPDYVAGKATWEANRADYMEMANDLDNQNKQMFEIIKYFKERTDNKSVIKPAAVKKFLKYAEDDVQLVKDTFDLACQQAAVEDIVAWMVAAIKDRYVDGKKEERRMTYGGYTDTEETREAIAKKAWENMQKKPEMSDFEEYIRNEIGEDIFSLTSYTDRVDCFIDWKKQHS